MADNRDEMVDGEAIVTTVDLPLGRLVLLHIFSRPYSPCSLRDVAKDGSRNLVVVDTGNCLSEFPLQESVFIHNVEKKL